MIGTLILSSPKATENRVRLKGWCCYLVANILMITFASMSSLFGILTLQTFFLYTSLRGIWHTRPRGRDTYKTKRQRC
jgi:hypothetical protein